MHESLYLIEHDESEQSEFCSHCAPQEDSHELVTVVVPVVHLSFASSQLEVKPAKKSQVNDFPSGSLSHVPMDGRFEPEQSLADPPHTPDVQTSDIVQYLPSSHTAPLFLAVISEVFIHL